MKCKKMYLDSVKQLLIGKKKNRKIFLNDLSHDIDEYLSGTPNASYADLERDFGTPVELLYEYASTQDAKELAKSVSFRRITIAFIIALSVALTSWNLLNTLWWNKTVHDLHEIEDWDNQIRPTIIIDNTEDSE